MGAKTSQMPNGTSNGSTGYLTIDTATITPKVVGSLRNHAIVVWIGMPAFAILQFLVMSPTCVDGFPLLSLVVPIAVVTHHLYAEHNAWYLTKGLITPPELTVLRHLGVLKRRRINVIFGIIEDLNMYTDLLFPIFAQSCHALTPLWVESIRKLPMVGVFFAQVVVKVRFWGASLLVCALMLFMGLVGLLRMRSQSAPGSSNMSSRDSSGPTRVGGKVFSDLSGYAESAIMPSVALLCDEMATQKRWMYDDSKDARRMVQGREDLILGKINEKTLTQNELRDAGEQQRVDEASAANLLVWLVVKVTICNVFQLWMQASFFALAFETMGRAAKIQLVTCMALSVIMVMVRSLRSSAVVKKLGGLGLAIGLMNVIAVVWIAAKIYFAFRCKDHVWGVFTGCVDRSNVKNE